MPTLEVSRTLVKSPPELWSELAGQSLSEAVGGAALKVTEEERTVRWEAGGARGTASLEPSGWGTRVTLRAEVEEAVAGQGLWARLGRRRSVAQTTQADLEQRLEALLDRLGSDQRKPFSRG
jgi:hypothetical protein